MGFLSRAIAERFEQDKPAELDVDIRLLSGTFRRACKHALSRPSMFERTGRIAVLVAGSLL